MQRLFDVGGCSHRCRRQCTLRAHAVGRKVSSPGLHRDHKGAAFSLLALNTHCPAVQRNQFLYQGQADPGALMRAGFCPLDPVETIEQTRQLCFRDTDSCVCHRKLCVIAAPAKPDRDAALEGVLEGVREEVEHDLLPHLLVYIHRLRQQWAVYLQGQASLLDRRAEDTGQFPGI